MNIVTLIGRLTKDPEVRVTTGEKSMTVARYTLAVDRWGKKDEADFISCVAFGRPAEFAEMYLHKGMKIAVSGRIQTGSYTNRDGHKVYTTDVVIAEQEFCEKQERTETRTEEPSSEFMDIPDGLQEELPFN